jgi:hemolysin activation/secretion protein
VQRRAAGFAALAICATHFGVATVVCAQTLAPGERPGERRIPDLGPLEQAAPPLVVPLPPPPESDRDRLSSGPRIEVRAFRVTGSTVFAPEELAAALAPFTGREITSQELLAARDAVTLLYVQRGYVNSGAVIPDQKIVGGVVELRVVEGRLAGVEIGGNRWFRSSYLRDRIAGGEEVPLDANALAERLEVLQQDPRFARLNAELVPGERPGEALLRVRVEETPPWHLDLQSDNYTSPSIGAYTGRAIASFDNPLGLGDAIGAMFAGSDGLRDVEGWYSIPVTRWDTAIRLRYRRSASDVVESPFDQLDISGKTDTFSGGIAQPVWRSRRVSAEVSVTAEYRRSDTYLFGDPFSFTPGLQDGRTRLTVLRIEQNGIYRDGHQVFAARSTFSVGLHVGDRADEAFAPEAHFFAWLAQLQYVRRFDSLRGTELVLRSDSQLTPDTLVPIEQFAVGGPTTVRGYRENQLVRDAGTIESIEVRVPVFRTAGDRVLIQLAPFFDCGYSWSARGPTFGDRWLTSAGIGIRGTFPHHILAELYWGQKLQSVPEPLNSDLQDDGVSFRVTVGAF